MTPENFTSGSSSRERYRLKTDNPHLDGIIVTLLERTEYGYVVQTGVGSGTYRALVTELEPLMNLNGNAQEVCVCCGSSNVVRTGKCSTCFNCGQPSGCS